MIEGKRSWGWVVLGVVLFGMVGGGWGAGEQEGRGVSYRERWVQLIEREQKSLERGENAWGTIEALVPVMLGVGREFGGHEQVRQVLTAASEGKGGMEVEALAARVVRAMEREGVFEKLVEVRGVRRAVARVPVEAGKPMFLVPEPAYGVLMMLGSACVLEARRAAERGDWGRFALMLETGWAMGRVSGAQAHGLFWIVGQRIRMLGLELVREQLVGERMDGGALEAVKGAMERQLGGWPRLGFAMEGERLVMRDLLEYVYPGGGALDPGRMQEFKALERPDRWRELAADSDGAGDRRSVEWFFDVSGEWLDRPRWERGGYDEAISAQLKGQGKNHFVAILGLSSFYRAARLADHIQVMESTVRAMIALEQYRNRVGRFPDRLAELVPGELDAVPRDSMRNEELVYAVRRSGQGYVLYSVGEDGEDNKGNLRRSWDGAPEETKGTDEGVEVDRGGG